VTLWRDGVPHALEVPTTAAALAFDQKGGQPSCRPLWWRQRLRRGASQARPATVCLEGSHIRVSFSPNGKFVVSVMSENALHGWRVKDAANMAMSGYPAKPRSLSWSADRRLLASSGTDGAIVWSFAGRDGPMGT
jgi:WD40 repeat protein